MHIFYTKKEKKLYDDMNLQLRLHESLKNTINVRHSILSHGIYSISIWYQTARQHKISLFQCKHAHSQGWCKPLFHPVRMRAHDVSR